MAARIDIMDEYLQEKFGATDEEMYQLEDLRHLRMVQRQTTIQSPFKYGSPSVVIDDFLFHGSLAHASNMKLLKELGIKHILNACDCQLDDKICENFNVLWINVDDELHADIKQYFDQTNQFLYDCKQKNEKVLVNCQMGISRSSSVVLAYLMKYHHDSLSKAYEYLLERRHIAAPNASFFIQLIRYEKELRATKEIDETKNNDDKQNPIEPLESKRDPGIINTVNEEGQTDL